MPGCHVPGSWCEIHHVQEHSRGGPTHTDNGVTLCWHHHRTLDSSGWEIRMDNGLPIVRGPAWWDPARRWRRPRPPLARHRRSRSKPLSAGTFHDRTSAMSVGG
ncbi:HNH endonuclease [Microbacterium sp. NPDC087591]|uniref:HNH endonuclease n=1 Tax=Microbacterium sp. NPDC087591 TaxID=3364192 RepID=UPI00381C0D1C